RHLPFAWSLYHTGAPSRNAPDGPDGADDGEGPTATSLDLASRARALTVAPDREAGQPLQHVTGRRRQPGHGRARVIRGLPGQPAGGVQPHERGIRGLFLIRVAAGVLAQ